MIRVILLRFFESFFRHVWLYLLPIVLMATLAIIYILITPPKYFSWGTLYIQDESLLASLNSLRDRGFSFTTPSEVSVDEISELFNSAAFMRAVAQNTNFEEKMTSDRKTVEKTLIEMREAVWAESTGERMVFIGSAHEDPMLAHQLAESTIDTYIQWKINVSQHGSAEAQRFFAELVEDYRSDLQPIRNALTDYLISHPEPVRGERPALEVAEIERIQADVTIAEERVANAESKEENARLALTQAESDVQQTYLIFDSPVLSVEPMNSLKDMAVTFVVFLIAGVFLSFVGIVGGAFLNRSLLFPVDVEQAFNLPVIASIPEIKQSVTEELEDEQPMRPFRWDKEVTDDNADYDLALPLRVSYKNEGQTNGQVQRENSTTTTMGTNGLKPAKNGIYRIK